MNLVAGFVVFLALVGLIYQMAAVLALQRFCRRPLPRRHAGQTGGITLLKPLRGLDQDTPACLASFLQQDYSPFQILFGVADPNDPVLPVVYDLQAKHPEVDVQIIICPRHLGLNPKVSTLRQLMPHARYNLLVISDSDVRVSPQLLSHLAAALEEPEVGLTSCLYRAGPVSTAGSALEALAISADFIPSVAVAHYLEGISFALGAVMAIRRQTLEQIGGFEVIADYLADDYQLGHRVRQAGWQVSVLPLVVATGQAQISLRGFLSHQLRWARTYRVCRPRGFLGYGITFALPWSLLAWFLSGLTAGGAGLVGACLLGRFLVAWRADQILGDGQLPRRFFCLLPLKDLISFALWIISFGGDKIAWQGQHYRVRPDGRLETMQ